MKKLILILSLHFAFFASNLTAQWYLQNPVDEDKYFNGCHFIDTLTGWVCGDNGLILHTTNGGISWIQQISNTQNHILRIKFFSHSSGWAVGYNGIILNTTDGGNTWVNISWTYNGKYFDLSVVDNSSCWIVSVNGIIIFTSDRGETWTQKSIPSNNNVYACHFIDHNIGWVSGQIYTPPHFNETFIKHSSNGGISWITQYQAIRSGGVIKSLYFLDENRGWAVGQYETQFKTTNGGTIWNEMSKLNGLFLEDVFFADSINGWTVQQSPYIEQSKVYSTVDGGNNWTYMFQRSFDLNEFSFVNKNCGWLVGAKGTILKTTDAGINWVNQYSQSLTTQYLQSVYFVNNDTGYIGGFGILFKTTNAGLNWEKLSLPINFSFTSFSFINSNEGWAGAGSKILRTKDGGINWIEQATGLTKWINSICFTDSLNGWAVGQFETILKTTDGGATWNRKYIISDSLNAFMSAYFIDENIGWVVGGYGQLLKTTNGGESWEVQVHDSTYWLYSVRFLNDSLGIVVGDHGAILKTTNAGQNWVNNPTGANEALRSVYIIDSLQAWAVGGWGTILRTTDGGLTWVNYPSPNIGENYLKSVFFINENIGYAVGQSGIIMKYDNITNVNDEKFNLLEHFILFQNYPNPFNPSTRIQYQVSSNLHVSLVVYDILGNEIETLVNEEKSPDTYEVTWNAAGLPSGVYFYQLRTGSFIDTKKMLLLK